MILASAYPNSALSALAMMTIGLVAAGTLALWLGLVFLADRTPRKPTAGHALELTDVAVPRPRSGELPRESRGAVRSGLTSEERGDEGGRKTAREGARR